MSIDYLGFLLLIILLSTILCTKMCFSFWRDYCLKTNFLSVSKNSVDIVLQRIIQLYHWHCLWLHFTCICQYCCYCFPFLLSLFVCVSQPSMHRFFSYKMRIFAYWRDENNEVTHNFILDFFDSCGVTIHIIWFYLHCPCSENLFWMVRLGVSFFSKICRWTLQQWCLTRGLYL